MPAHTQKIRQRQHGDKSEYWTENAGRYTLSSYNKEKDKTIYSIGSDRYDYKTHTVTIKVDLENLLELFPSKSVEFQIDTIVSDVGKSEYNPRYSYSISLLYLKLILNFPIRI